MFDGAFCQYNSAFGALCQYSFGSALCIIKSPFRWLFTLDETLFWGTGFWEDDFATCRQLISSEGFSSLSSRYTFSSTDSLNVNVTLLSLIASFSIWIVPFEVVISSVVPVNDSLRLFVASLSDNSGLDKLYSTFSTRASIV